MHTIQKIIDNQKSHKDLILKFLNNNIRDSKKTLYEIKSNDKYINSEVKKLKLRFKKCPHKKEIDKLFFMHPNRNETFYVWWDSQEDEAIILNYGKK